MSSEDASHYIGVDRCSGSWLAVVYADREYDRAEVFDEIGELWHRYEETAERIAIDIPIGLREEGAEPRPCEPLAREVLGPRRSSVFPPPVREATRKRTYRAAKRVNERKADRSLSAQSYAIADAIASVDKLLQALDAAREVFVETHPEVCFRAFAGTSLQYSKTVAAGYAERMRALAEHEPGAPRTVQRVAAATGGRDVAVDDVLDAVAAALTARPGPGTLRSLPEDPPADEAGLPMRMVYRASEPLVVP